MSQSVDLKAPEFHFEGTELKIHARAEGHEKLPEDGAIVDMSGDLNLYSTPRVKNILNKLVDAGKIKLYLNVEELHYIDSSGLGAFLSIQSRLMKIKGFLRICNPSKQVLSVLELTKLKSMLRVSRTLDDALNAKL